MMHYWVQKHSRLSSSITPHKFTTTVAEEWTAWMKAEADETETSIIVAPKKFKKDTKWHEFCDSVITYLHAKKGQEATPLAYIIQEHDEPAFDIVYFDEHVHLLKTLPFTGSACAFDNGISSSMPLSLISWLPSMAADSTL